MGILFVILIHLIVIFILSTAIAIVGCVATWYFSKKERLKRKIIFAIISPFIGLYSFYFVALMSAAMISGYKNIDIGIGDEWYVPLSNHCRLLFIDVPEQAYIEHNGHTVISEVSKMQQSGNSIFGKTNQGQYFVFNTMNAELKEFSSEIDFQKAVTNDRLSLEDAIDFYYDRRNEIAGLALSIAGIASLLVSISIVYLVKRIVFSKVWNARSVNAIASAGN